MQPGVSGEGRVTNLRVAFILRALELICGGLSQKASGVGRVWVVGWMYKGSVGGGGAGSESRSSKKENFPVVKGVVENFRKLRIGPCLLGIQVYRELVKAARRRTAAMLLKLFVMEELAGADSNRLPRSNRGANVEKKKREREMLLLWA